MWFLYICRVLVRHARKIAQQYYLMYQEEIPTAQLVQKLASVIQEYTQSGWEEISEKEKKKNIELAKKEKK